MQQYIMSKSSYCNNWLPCLKPSSVISIPFPTGPHVIRVAHTSQLPLKSLCPFHDTHRPRWPPSVPWTCPNCLLPQKSCTDTCCTLYLESPLPNSQHGWLLPIPQFQLNYPLFSKSFPNHPHRHSLSWHPV